MVLIPSSLCILYRHNFVCKRVQFSCIRKSECTTLNQSVAHFLFTFYDLLADAPKDRPTEVAPHRDTTWYSCSRWGKQAYTLAFGTFNFNANCVTYIHHVCTATDKWSVISITHVHEKNVWWHASNSHGNERREKHRDQDVFMLNSMWWD